MRFDIEFLKKMRYSLDYDDREFCFAALAEITRLGEKIIKFKGIDEKTKKEIKENIDNLEKILPVHNSPLDKL